MRHQHAGHVRQHGDRRKVAYRVVWQFAVKRQTGGEQAAVSEEQRIAIGRGFRNGRCRNLPVRAAAIVHYDGLPQ